VDRAACYNVDDAHPMLTSVVTEYVLIKDGTFSLPGKKALLKSDMEYEVVLIDVTETPVERPKRGKNTTIQERKSGTR
jgi:hypothetical protein